MSTSFRSTKHFHIGAIAGLLIALMSSARADHAAVSGDRPGARSASVFVPGFQSDFVTGYLSPTQLYQRINELAVTFPDIAEIVQLPEKTSGYHRPAQAVLGTSDDSRVAVESRAWGHEGGNGLAVFFVNPGLASFPLSVAVNGRQIGVLLGTDASGSVISTAAQVVAALNANTQAAAIVIASTFRGNAGAGIVAPESVVLADGLSAPPEVSRDPQVVHALRIGKARDGSKPGVLMYAQEHGNEWVPPLVLIETAERLLRNHALDPTISSLVDNFEIFVVPSVNPDGGHFSFYDYAPQRKNMTRYCPANAASDFLARTSWGVDIDRNFAVGSVSDGFTGASTLCTSDTFAGPSPLSEPESRNLDWIAHEFSNIHYALNLQSPGPSVTWSPGASTAAGVGLTKPDMQQEALLRGVAERIVVGIEGYRGTSIAPAAIGARIDVQQSAAGNSADHLWYHHGISAWTLGVGTETQPPFSNPDADGPSAHAESQEFADGLIELLRLLRDRPSPTVTLDGSTHSLRTGESATISWSSTNATLCNASGGAQLSGRIATSGSAQVQAGTPGTLQLSLTCYGLFESVSADWSISVSAPPPPSTSGGSSQNSPGGGGALGVGTILGLAALCLSRRRDTASRGTPGR